jgi:hypothetical protein
MTSRVRLYRSRSMLSAQAVFMVNKAPLLDSTVLLFLVFPRAMVPPSASAIRAAAPHLYGIAAEIIPSTTSVTRRRGFGES